MTLTATLVAPTRGPQGPQGLHQRSGSGPPTASTPGEAGERYTDTTNAANYGPFDGTTGWPTTLRSLMGPKGPQGLAGAATTDGVGNLVASPAIPVGGNYGLSDNRQFLGGLSGSAFDHVYVQNGCSLVGLALNILSSGNLTALNVHIYSNATESVAQTVPIPAANLFNGPQGLSFPSSQYPLPGPTRYYLQVSGSGSVYLIVTPTYGIPQMATVALTPWQAAALPATTTYSATPTVMLLPGTPGRWTFYGVRTAVLYDGTIVNRSSGAVQLQFVNAAGTVIYTTPQVPAGAKYPLGPLDSSACVFRPLAGPFTCQVIGSGTGSVFFQPRVIQ